MCLELRNVDSDKPYNGSNIRWKYIDIEDGVLSAPYYDFKYKSIGQEDIVENVYNLGDFNIGFHVYVNKNDAINDAKINQAWCDISRRQSIYIKILVKDFIRSGHFYRDESETWKSMTILKVYNVNGRNITRQFKTGVINSILKFLRIP